MIVVSDSSPIISLSMIGQLELLRELYQEIILPQAVYQEIVEEGRHRPGFSEVLEADWIITRSISSESLSKVLALNLGKGEAEAITLASDVHAELLLMDERKGRRVAFKLGIDVVGILGVLVEAKHKSLITLIKPMLDELLHEAGFRMSQTLYDKVLETVGETS